MLQNLTIKNYALINELEIQFDSGFAILTGETGAGKSILLGALSLILGERADMGVLLDKNKKCIVEGEFQISEFHLKDFFLTNNLDYEEFTIIRREIKPNEKSRAFINDTPVNLNVLKSLGSKLVDIHSQNKNLILNDLKFQLKIVDTLAKNQKLLIDYSKCYYEYKSTLKLLNETRENAEKSRNDLDYFKFQFDQLQKAQLENEEQERLEKELELLNHAEDIKMALSSSFSILSGNEQNIVSSLNDVSGFIGKLVAYYDKSKDFGNRVDSVLIELKDLASEIEIASEDIEYEPKRINIIKERLDLIYELEQKHKVSSIKELVNIQNGLEQKIDTIGSFEQEISDLEKQAGKLKTDLTSKAKQISVSRKKATAPIEKSILKILQKLGMPDASLKIELTDKINFSDDGKDNVKFLFSSNTKIEGREISKVASGGELSRVMLAVKSLISEFTALPTIIFDEIDSGVSGDIADKMGEIMKQMSKQMQVIGITHLPQIAGKGDTHFLVYKDNSFEIPKTGIKKLNKNERLNEIAKMLSGKKLTDAALQNAKELLNE